MPIACAVFTFLRPHRHQITDHLIRSKKWGAATVSLKPPRTLYNSWLIFRFVWLLSTYTATSMYFMKSCNVKGVSSKCSGNLIVSPDLCFFELETSNFGYLLIFSFCWAVQSFSKIGQHWYYTFYKGPPFDFFDFLIYQKFKGGTLIKCQM